MAQAGKIKGNLTTGNPLTCMMKYLVPLILGNLFQQFYSIADSIIVGRMISADALAAVGSTSTLTGLFVMVALGTGVGCSIVISQLFGAEQLEKMKTAISTELISVLVFSLLLSIVGLLTGGTLLTWLNTPANIYEAAKTYLNIYFYGFFFLFLYNAFTSVFNAMGDSKKPLFFLLFSSALNIGLDIYFIGPLRMGVAGAAWATLIAQAVSAILSFIALMMKLSGIKTEKYDKFDVTILKTMVKVAIPSILQQSVVSIGSLLIQGCVNQFGSVFLAGYSAGSRIDGIAIVPLVNCGNAVSTFVAQNVGAKKLDRAKQGCRIGIAMAVAFSLILAILLQFYGRNVVSLFMDSEIAADSITIGTTYLSIVSKCYLLMGLMKIFAGVLRGSGDMKCFVYCTMINLGIRVALTYAFAKATDGMIIAWAIGIGWGVAAMVAYIRYRQGGWQKIQLI